MSHAHNLSARDSHSLVKLHVSYTVQCASLGTLALHACSVKDEKTILSARGATFCMHVEQTLRKLYVTVTVGNELTSLFFDLSGTEYMPARASSEFSFFDLFSSLSLRA